MPRTVGKLAVALAVAACSASELEGLREGGVVGSGGGAGTGGAVGAAGSGGAAGASQADAAAGDATVPDADGSLGGDVSDGAAGDGSGGANARDGTAGDDSGIADARPDQAHEADGATLPDSGVQDATADVPPSNDGASDAPVGDSLCADYKGGALVTFAVAGELLRVWITDGAFIDEAIQQLANGDSRIPVFMSLLEGKDCDRRWTWHPDPAKVSFADTTIELCDGLPSHVENDKDYWFHTVKVFCPWSAKVKAVDDRR